METQTSFIDAESSYSTDKDPISFRLIVLIHLKNIGTYFSNELRGGYWHQQANPNISRNDTIDTYVPDKRETVSNAVEYLYSLIYPYADESLKKVGDDCEEKILKAYKDFSKEWENTAEPVTYKEAIEYHRTFPKQRFKSTYRIYRLTMMKKLFREICCFLKRADYFKGVMIEDA